MRISLLIAVMSLILVTVPAMADDVKEKDSLALLRREIVQLIKNDLFVLSHTGVQDVTIGFMINAKNEIIVLDVKGDNTGVCEHVKASLNYRTVKFNQSRQLIRYSITVQLVGN